MGRPPGSKNGKKAASNGTKRAPAEKAPRKSAAAKAPAPPPSAPRPAAAAKAPEKRSNVPTPEERTGWLAEYTKFETEKQRISGDISALSSRVKSKGGVKAWKSLKTVHGYKKLDKDEAIALLEDLVVSAAQQEIRISWMGNQATFSDIMEQPETQPAAAGSTAAVDLAGAKAESDGYNSGKLGAIPSDNPFRHKPGSTEYVSWHNGRDRGEADRQGAKPRQAQRLKDSLAADATLPNETSPAAPVPGPEPLF